MSDFELLFAFRFGFRCSSISRGKSPDCGLRPSKRGGVWLPRLSVRVYVSGVLSLEFVEVLCIAL